MSKWANESAAVSDGNEFQRNDAATGNVRRPGLIHLKCKSFFQKKTNLYLRKKCNYKLTLLIMVVWACVLNTFEVK